MVGVGKTARGFVVLVIVVVEVVVLGVIPCMARTPCIAIIRKTTDNGIAGGLIPRKNILWYKS